jgi:hypothetical protein
MAAYFPNKIRENESSLRGLAVEVAYSLEDLEEVMTQLKAQRDAKVALPNGLERDLGRMQSW